jgi:ABC-type multidrug transport system fused ATPase/permease subunit
MLDECISSLDEENSTNVLRVLTENYKGLVLCVCHQVIQGSFAHIINL